MVAAAVLIMEKIYPGQPTVVSGMHAAFPSYVIYMYSQVLFWIVLNDAQARTWFNWQQVHDGCIYNITVLLEYGLNYASFQLSHDLSGSWLIREMASTEHLHNIFLKRSGAFSRGLRISRELVLGILILYFTSVNHGTKYTFCHHNNFLCCLVSIAIMRVSTYSTKKFKIWKD